MSILRVMTYALKNSSADRAEEVAQIIRAQRPELVFLQHLDEGLLAALAEKTGQDGHFVGGSCAFLSRHPLKALQPLPLGEGGQCLRADLDLGGKRLHLFNVQLVVDPARRGHQIARLFDADLLGARLPCASLVAGDFSLPLWGGGQWLLRRHLKPVTHTGWGANYPAIFPLWPRDRFYLNGPIRSLAGQVVSAAAVRRVSRHLPLVATLELTDTRDYLKIPEVAEQRMRPVAG